MSNMRFTAKQMNILSVILAGNGLNQDGSRNPIDLDEILERINWRTSKASMQFSLRYLIDYGMIEKVGHAYRRGRNRAIFLPTINGIKAYNERETTLDPSVAAGMSSDIPSVTTD